MLKCRSPIDNVYPVMEEDDEFDSGDELFDGVDPDQLIPDSAKRKLDGDIDESVGRSKRLRRAGDGSSPSISFFILISRRLPKSVMSRIVVGEANQLTPIFRGWLAR